MDKIELNIIALSDSTSSPGNYALILEEQNGPRRLPIIVGTAEAQAIAVALERMQVSRPLTHDLFKNAFDALGASLKEVWINELKEEVFHAELKVKTAAGSSIGLDARSSDAIALAIRFDCPIFTTEAIMATASFSGSSLSKAFLGKRGSLTDYGLEELEQLLAQLLAKEDYESASKVRDAIEQKKSQ